MNNNLMITDTDLTVIQQCLEQANPFGLQVEIVAWALKFIKEDPNLSIADAMTAGYREWVK